MEKTQRLSEAIRAHDLAAVDALIAEGVEVNACHEPHCPPLFQAVEHQQAEIARRLIAAGADINRDAGQGWTPLAHAIDSESDAASQAGLPPESVATELVELLLAAGAKPTARAFELAAAYCN